jgi:RimJ/RimL family protein N-acetyltransferase
MDDFCNDAERAAQGAWETERLVYRAFEESDKEWYAKEHWNDSLVLGMGSPTTTTPSNQKSADKIAELMLTAALACVVCLKPEEEARLAATDEGAKILATVGKDEKASGKEGDEKKTATENGTTLAREGAAAETKPQEPLTRIGLIILHNPDFAGVTHHRKLELGVSFVRNLRGRGYGGEAIDWALDQAFLTFNLHRVTLHCFGYNTRAQRTYRRLGFVEEGREREALWFQRQYWDSITFGMLESEWEKLRGYKAKEKSKQNMD